MTRRHSDTTEAQAQRHIGTETDSDLTSEPDK